MFGRRWIWHFATVIVLLILNCENNPVDSPVYGINDIIIRGITFEKINDKWYWMPIFIIGQDTTDLSHISEPNEIVLHEIFVRPKDESLQLTEDLLRTLSIHHLDKVRIVHNPFYPPSFTIFFDQGMNELIYFEIFAKFRQSNLFQTVFFSLKPRPLV